MAFLASIKKRTDLRVRGVAKEADDRDPTTITDIPWIGELDPKRFAELASGGKWMLFYSHDKIWPHWKKCQQLYRNNKLKGVSNMKVSTCHYHHSSSVGVIILYCGPPNDEKKVKEIGRNILQETEYTNLSKKMFYKTDTQTLSKGAAGWHKFELPIPQINFDKLKMQPINKALPAKHPKISTDEYIPYTRQYLQSLSKSDIIDIAIKLQQKTNNSPPTAPMAPMAPMAPKLINNPTVPNTCPMKHQTGFLSAIEARRPKEKAIHIKYGEYFHKNDEEKKESGLVKIVAISDTHMEHENLNMPKGDILIFSGDYTNDGTIEEAKIVNEWIGKIKKKKKYKYVLLINGNHEGFGDIILN
eukprot:250526_1